MSQNFTEKLREYFLQNTNLTLVQYDGDLQIEGSIVSYGISPYAPTNTGNSNANNASIAALQRLAIGVKCSYTNTQDDQFDFNNKTFSFYRDYDPNQEPFTSNENAFIDEITQQIVIDIFNATVSNW